MNKKEIRKLYLAKRLALTDHEYGILNQKLFDQFKKTDFNTIGSVLFYLPIAKRREPDTSLLVNWLKVTHPKIKIAYPRVDFETLSMTCYWDDGALQLTTNQWGIPEPLSGNIAGVAALDMLIVPLLAFDKLGYRVGYGKGFYDRFMAQCKPDARFTGLSFFEPVEAIDDIDQYDVRMHQCVMPGEVCEWK